MKELIEYILQFGYLSKEQITLIEQKATEIQLEKDAYFSRAGKTPRQVGFLVEGVIITTKKARKLPAALLVKTVW